ncbi:MAG TPA: hypothetical protein VNS55_08585 [Nocardioides sp.]|nr:hypothetical protein [Nocardioides sp.]
MRWLRKMQRKRRCRKKYGAHCPHLERHSPRPTRIEKYAGKHV